MTSSTARYTLYEIAKNVTSTQTTTHFRHLLPVKKAYLESAARKATPVLKEPFSRTKDRIKWWNIVPGDQIRIASDEGGTIREVLSVDKLRNKVYVKKENREDGEVEKQEGLPVHYSEAQLYLGDYTFPAAPGSTQTKTIPVFAKRLGTSEPRWEKYRWVWERYAIATSPRLPTWTKGIQQRVHMPWPERKKPLPLLDATLYDTLSAVVAEVTYEPPSIPERPPLFALPKKAEDEYLSMLRNEREYDQTRPMESYIARELSNPHSRTKKRIRWKAAFRRRQQLLVEMVRAEFKRLNGRTRQDARAEAVFKWKERIAAERKATLKKRATQRGQDARVLRRRERKRKQTERLARRLQNLVLPEKPNQVLPEDAVA